MDLKDYHCFLATMLMPLMMLGGCAAVPVAAVEIGSELVFPTVLGSAVGDWRENDKSYSAGGKITLAATQQALRQLNLRLDVVEFEEKDDYKLRFYGDDLEGKMDIDQQTSKITTVSLKVRSLIRESSVETLIFEKIQKKLDSLKKNTRFNRKGYNNLRAEPTTMSAIVGIYRKGAPLNVKESKTELWLQTKLPSHSKAYLKGNLADFEEKK